ncbi:MAG: hypothetical protein R2688_01385 [Fimbriimonadaceae bacterium]
MSNLHQSQQLIVGQSFGVDNPRPCSIHRAAISSDVGSGNAEGRS